MDIKGKIYHSRPSIDDKYDGSRDNLILCVDEENFICLAGMHRRSFPHEILWHKILRLGDLNLDLMNRDHFKEVSLEDLPLYISWPHISPNFPKLLSGEVSVDDILFWYAAYTAKVRKNRV